jgi:hypothetical protein
MEDMGLIMEEKVWNEFLLLICVRREKGQGDKF